MHEDKIAEDSGLPMNTRGSEVKIKHWKLGWIEEIEDELRNRLMVIKDKEEK